VEAKLHSKAFGQNRNFRFGPRIKGIARQGCADRCYRADVDYSPVPPAHTTDYRSGGMDQSFDIDPAHASNLLRIIGV
jgi:hypothetical protein